MSLRPNRAAAAAASGGGGTPSSYGGYPAGYGTPGYGGGAAPSSGGGASYYQSPGAAAPSPYGGGGGGVGYNTNNMNGAYGGGAGGATSGGYNTGAGSGGGGGYSGGAYGGYSGGTPVYSSSGGADTSFKDKPKKRKSKASDSGSSTVAMLCAVLALLFVISTVHFRGQRNKLLKELRASSVNEAIERYQQDMEDLKNERHLKKESSKAERRLTSNVQSLERDLQKCRSDKENVMAKHSEVTRALDEHRESVGEEAERFVNRDSAWANSVEILQGYTQRESRRQALERFGPGPHHVRFSVLLPSDRERKPRHFVVECAPLDQMPHAVHLFLEQVMHGLWNNAWFYLNGPHVIQGGPQASEDGQVAAVNRFKELSLDTLAFPEYSPDFPHEKYTLGFTGRPGGPDFYINKMNNTEAHGPGGQHQHHLEEFADPCFAKVIDGFETLDMIYNEQTFPQNHEWGWFLVHPVHIVGATLLEQTMPPPEEKEELDLAKEPENQNPFPDKPLHVHKLDEHDHQVVP